jgi:hypothetical protein
MDNERTHYDKAFRHSGYQRASRNRPFTEGMIFHSNRGIKYAC